MTQGEKRKMTEVYSNQFKHYLLSNKDTMERFILAGQKEMMCLFFTKHEIKAIENNERVTSEYKRELFKTVMSWLETVEKNENEEKYPFNWDEKGLDKVEEYYSYLFSDEKYKGFKLSIELARKSLEN